MTRKGQGEPIRIWALLGARAGDNNQVIGLAEALGLPFEVKALEYNGLRRLAAKQRDWLAGDLAILLELARLRPRVYELELDGADHSFTGTLVAVGRGKLTRADLPHPLGPRQIAQPVLTEITQIISITKI